MYTINKQQARHIACYTGYHVDRMAQDAIRFGNLPLLRYAVSQGCLIDGICYRAAKSGHLHVIQWAKQAGCKIYRDTCCTAAGRGHLHIVRWCIERGEVLWSFDIGKVAAYHGAVNVLQWALDNNLPMDSIWNNAVAGGQLAVLQWALSNNYPRDGHEVYCAARDGHLDVLKWLLNHEFAWDLSACKVAIEHG